MRMARDPLAALARLRRLQTGLAQHRLAEQYTRLAAAEHRSATAAAALQAEQAAGSTADYAAWLTRGLAERDRAARGLGLAETRTAEARTGLTLARTAERALEDLRAQRAAAVAKQDARRTERMLDDLVGGRQARP
jgi:hypothetical protein